MSDAERRSARDALGGDTPGTGGERGNTPGTGVPRGVARGGDADTQTAREALRAYAALARRRADTAARLRAIEQQLEAAQPAAIGAFDQVGRDTVIRWRGMELSLGEDVKVRAVPDSATLTAALIEAGRRDLLMPSYPALRSLALHGELPELPAVESSAVTRVNAKRISDKRRGSRRRG
jgi:hypothetical protein